MRRVYHPYHTWEDFRVGMFNPSDRAEEHRDCARALLADPAGFLAAMRAMVAEWPVAAEHNLTALDTNRRAWLGAAACCHHCGSREHTTREAWWSLTSTQQDAANAAAEDLIAEWERAYSGADALFPWPPAEVS